MFPERKRAHGPEELSRNHAGTIMNKSKGSEKKDQLTICECLQLKFRVGTG